MGIARGHVLCGRSDRRGGGSFPRCSRAPSEVRPGHADGSGVGVPPGGRGGGRSMMDIAIPRETRAREHRVALTPSGAKALVQGGHRLWVETGAGANAGHPDDVYSGFGGQLDFVRGSARAKGGKPIIALPSTAKAGRISRIVDVLPEGSGVVTTRADVHYVVTEHGIARLHGRRDR